MLTQEHRIGAHLLPPGSVVHLGETGALEQVVLGAEAVCSGQVLPAKASVFFESDGRLRCRRRRGRTGSAVARGALGPGASRAAPAPSGPPQSGSLGTLLDL